MDRVAASDAVGWTFESSQARQKRTEKRILFSVFLFSTWKNCNGRAVLPAQPYFLYKQNANPTFLKQTFRLKSLQKHPNEFFIDRPIGLISHGQVDPGLFIHHTFSMGKGLKARFSVVGSHAACAHAAKAHLTGGQVDNRVVDTAAAKLAPIGDSLDLLFIL